MDLSRFFRSKPSPDDPGSPAERPRSEIDPETATRRRSRLERRIANLESDIAQAESARDRDNRWNRRVAEINQAIEQTRIDIERIEATLAPAPPITLPPTPVSGIEVNPDMPASVHFEIGQLEFRYAEEIDWTERGEQRAQPALRRFEGDPAELAPDATPDDRRDALNEHLHHTLAALAVNLRDGALDGQSPPQLTLADLASPCPVCGGWRDLRDRCIACQRREWEANAMRDEMQRLLEERNSQIEEIASQIEALPVLQRQLADARAELERYQL